MGRSVPYSLKAANRPTQELDIDRPPSHKLDAYSIHERPDAGSYYATNDNDLKFTTTFDAFIETEGFHVIHPPFHALNAHAERWVQSVGEECVDINLILNRAHFRRVLGEYVEGYCNIARPHLGLEQMTTIPHHNWHHLGLFSSALYWWPDHRLLSRACLPLIYHN